MITWDMAWLSAYSFWLDIVVVCATGTLVAFIHDLGYHVRGLGS